MEGIGLDEYLPVIEVEIGFMRHSIDMGLPTNPHRTIEMMACH
jgi:hypothetical protein